jgi:hypothetical protein
LNKRLDEFLSKMLRDYLREVKAQTRGSHRTKRANKHGLSLVFFLNALAGTSASQSIAGCLGRAQLRLRLVGLHKRRRLHHAERLFLIASLLERSALHDLLELDHMEALGATNRVRQCRDCSSWFWSRVRSQRYCSEKCRVRHFRASPEGKRYKREWARRDYERIKERDKRLLETARASLCNPRPHQGRAPKTGC